MPMIYINNKFLTRGYKIYNLFLPVEIVAVIGVIVVTGVPVAVVVVVGGVLVVLVVAVVVSVAEEVVVKVSGVSPE